MVEAWLIGGTAAHARIALDSSCPPTLSLTLPDGESVDYHYVGDLALLEGKIVHLFRHGSIRPEEITSFVRLARAPLSHTSNAHLSGSQSGYSPPRSPVRMRYV